MSQPPRSAADPRTRLLSQAASPATSTEHGTFRFEPSPSGSRPSSPSVRTSANPSNALRAVLPSTSWLKRAATTTELARESGVRHPRVMYASYYIPSIAWIGRYEWSYLVGDVVAGSTLFVPAHVDARD